jgi:hypothetical protein
MNATDLSLCQIVLQRKTLRNQIRRYPNLFKNGFPVDELTRILPLDAALDLGPQFFDGGLGRGQLATKNSYALIRSPCSAFGMAAPLQFVLQA